MKYNRFPPEASERLLSGPAGLDLRESRVQSREVVNGYKLKCGQVDLFLVPLQSIFAPNKLGLTHIVNVNAEVFYLAHEDSRLARIMSATVNTIDGRVLQGICKFLYPSYQILRQNGSSFIFDLAEHCQKNSESLFLLGSTERANALAAQSLRARFPGLQVSGFSPPFDVFPFHEGCNARILQEIERARPRQLIVCFGAPKQEYWIHENSPRLSELGVRCAYGLGATIDFVAGVKARAPKWIEFIGVEWFFRLACEPRARFRRTLRMFKMFVYATKTTRQIEPMFE
jgi:N-acetylglucosaminyldiphosphoundecaprenol N-acetyl-beta-D-mannosaminyltransferase